MGSIPPAASIEHPQREIVNLIADAAMTPSEFDLHQLARGVQGGRLNYAIDNGTANQYSINVNPPLTAYAAGQRWTVRILNTNTGPSTININGLGARHIVSPQETELIGGELFAGGLASLVDDGAHLQLTSGGGAAATVTSSILSAPKHYYVNGTTGSDTLYDGLSATVGVGTIGPFKTLQHAQLEIMKFNLNGYDVFVHVADGTYTAAGASMPVCFLGQVNGTGTVHYVGNVANPSACLISNSAGPCFLVGGFFYTLDGFKLTCTGRGDPLGSAGQGNGIWSNGAGAIELRAVEFGYCIDYHMAADAGGFIRYGGPITISGGCPGAHIAALDGAYVRQFVAPSKLSILNSVSVGQFILAANCGIVYVTLSPLSGAGFVSGQKFYGYGNGIVYTAGAGAGYYPGTVGGTLTTGAQYI